MANYAASVLEEAKLILTQRFSAPEKRIKPPANVLAAFMKNTDLAIPNVGQLRTAAARAEKGYFFNRSKRANTSARAHDHTGSVGDSTEVAFTWATYGDKFKTSLKRSENNIFNDAQIMANEIENAFKNIYESADAAALAYLGTNKTEVNVATKNGVFDATNFVFEIATANIARFIQHAKSMMRQNYHTGVGELILDPVLFLNAEHYLQQGGANSTNLAYQIAGVNLWEAITLEDADYPLGSGYIIPEGTIGVVDWTPQKNRMGWGDYESYNGGYGTIIDPRTGMTMALHGYSQRADTASAGGEVQDVTTEWEITVDLSFNNSPLTTASETTIFELGIIDTPAS